LNLKPNLNLELETLEKRNRKRIRKSREKEKGKAAQQPSLAQPGRTPARPRRLTGGIHLSAATLSPPRSLSLSLALCPLGLTCRRQLFPLRASLPSLPRGPMLPGTEPLPPCAPFLSLSLRHGPSLSVPPSPHPSWTGACALAHVARILGHDAHPRALAPS
jgi:hypothetical protein